MIWLRRNTERHRLRKGKGDVRLTFYPHGPPGPRADGFGVLAAFNEIRLPPDGASAPMPDEEAEIVTYVYRGTLAQEESAVSSGLVRAGEFQIMATSRGTRRKETNASRTDWAHVFRISLRPSEVGRNGAREQKRFATAQRRNVLCVVASQDGRAGSLRIRQDALVCSSELAPGRHIIHELLPGRNAWIHVIRGEVTLQDQTLTQGDGAGFVTEPSASFTAVEDTEILLVDLRGSELKVESGQSTG